MLAGITSKARRNSALRSASALLADVELSLLLESPEPPQAARVSTAARSTAPPRARIIPVDRVVMDRLSEVAGQALIGPVVGGWVALRR